MHAVHVCTCAGALKHLLRLNGHACWLFPLGPAYLHQLVLAARQAQLALSGFQPHLQKGRQMPHHQTSRGSRNGGPQ